jgi:hypothetical protein
MFWISYTRGQKFRLTWAISESAKLRFPANRGIGKGLGNGQGDRDHTFGLIGARTARACREDRGR